MNTSTPEWEERFDKLFWEHRVPRFTKQSADIKSFIAETLTSERTKIREMCCKECREKLIT